MTLAGMLRISTVVAYAAAVGLALGLIHLGAPTWLAVLLGIALPLAIHGVPLAIEFATGALIDRRPGARLGPWTLARVWLRETWRSFMVFNVDQPWRAAFPVRCGKSRPVVDSGGSGRLKNSRRRFCVSLTAKTGVRVP